MSLDPELYKQTDGHLLTREQYKDERDDRLVPSLLEERRDYTLRLINELSETSELNQGNFATDFIVRLGSMSGREDGSFDITILLRSADGRFAESAWGRAERITLEGIVGPKGVEEGYFLGDISDIDKEFQDISTALYEPLIFRQPEQKQAMHMPLPGDSYNSPAPHLPTQPPIPPRWSNW